MIERTRTHDGRRNWQITESLGLWESDHTGHPDYPEIPYFAEVGGWKSFSLTRESAKDLRDALTELLSDGPHEQPLSETTAIFREEGGRIISGEIGK